MKTDKERTVEFLKSLGIKFIDFGHYLTIAPFQEKNYSTQDIDFMFSEDGSFLRIEVDLID